MTSGESYIPAASTKEKLHTEHVCSGNCFLFATRRNRIFQNSFLTLRTASCEILLNRFLCRQSKEERVNEVEYSESANSECVFVIYICIVPMVRHFLCSSPPTKCPDLLRFRAQKRVEPKGTVFARKYGPTTRMAGTALRSGPVYIIHT